MTDPTAGEDESDGTLVARARRNDATAWASIVSRYTPLVRSIARQHRLSEDDGCDVSQTVWLQLATHVHGLRDAHALPGWIATTTRRACLDLLKARARRAVAIDPLGMAEICVGEHLIEDRLLREERTAAVWAALAELPRHHQELMQMLIADPPVPYEEISKRLKLPIGSIGPIRGRCLEKLRSGPAMRALAA